LVRVGIEISKKNLSCFSIEHRKLRNFNALGHATAYLFCANDEDEGHRLPAKRVEDRDWP
jgi:hypothetical protein